MMLAAPATATASLPKVLAKQTEHGFKVRPASISFTGDGTGIVGGADGASARHPGHLHWTRYNRHEGAAKGVVWLDDCDPSCAEGEFSPVPVKVHVGRVRHGRFTRLTLRFTYNGERIVDRRGIRHIGGSYPYWAYYIIG
jgi:hypothetical protein